MFGRAKEAVARVEPEGRKQMVELQISTGRSEQKSGSQHSSLPTEISSYSDDEKRGYEDMNMLSFAAGGESKKKMSNFRTPALPVKKDENCKKKDFRERKMMLECVPKSPTDIVKSSQKHKRG